MLDRRIGDHIRQRVCKVFNDDDRAGAGILHLVPQFAAGVHRVDVDRDQAGTKNAGQHDRILQDIGQHDGNALALRQPEFALQVAGEFHRQLIEFTIGHRCAHARKRRPVRVITKTSLDHVTQ